MSDFINKLSESSQSPVTITVSISINIYCCEFYISLCYSFLVLQNHKNKQQWLMCHKTETNQTKKHTHIQDLQSKHLQKTGHATKPVSAHSYSQLCVIFLELHSTVLKMWIYSIANVPHKDPFKGLYSVMAPPRWHLQPSIMVLNMFGIYV